MFSFGVSSASAQEFGSHEYCDQLAEIGMNAYNAKKQGHSLSDVTTTVTYVLQDDVQKRTAAVGVITAIYGDASIVSASSAYSIVYNTCKQ